MRTYFSFGLAVAAALLAADPCRAGLLINGGFESPALALGAYQTIGPGGEPAGFAWQVSSGTVDLGSLPVSPFIQYSAFEGNQALDLNGDNRGELFQDFATTIGQSYVLSFAYADNPLEGGISSASVAVTDVGTSASLLLSSVSHSTSTNGPPPDADWQIFTGSFTAVGTTTRLAFASTSASNSASGGIILDAVTVDVLTVPEPSSIVMLGLGGIGLLGYGRRRRKTASA